MVYNLSQLTIHFQLAVYKLLKRIKVAGINTFIQYEFTASDWKIVKVRISKKDELRGVKVDAPVIDVNLIKQESNNK